MAQDDATSRDDAGTSCAGRAPGTFHEQTFEHDGETRTFELFVPSAYDCTRGWPLLVDFHGAYGADKPEEAYINEGLLAVAERRGVIVARLRARPHPQDGRTWYHWDYPNGDLTRNRLAAAALVAKLSAELTIDAARVWASGYSSGGNLVLGFLGHDTPFRAVGAVGAGLWSPVALPKPLPVGAPRVYSATGYKDSFITTWKKTERDLRDRGYDDEKLFVRETDEGHAFLAWHVDEMLSWFETGAVPAPPPKAATWEKLASPSAATLLEISRTAAGGFVVSTADGHVYAGDGATWRSVWQSDLPVPVIGLSAAGTGLVAVTTPTTAAVSTDDGASFRTAPALPSIPQLGEAWVGAVAAGSTEVVALGAHLSFLTVPRPAPGDVDLPPGPIAGPWRSTEIGAEAHAVAVLASGDVVGAGMNGFAFRGSDARGFLMLELPPSLDGKHLHAIASMGSSVWMVGEGGLVLRSIDEGKTFAQQATPTAEDLYAVVFDSPLRGAAVGAHGAALMTVDGGTTWRDVSLGRDVTLAGVAFDRSQRPLVVGSQGTILRLQP